MNALVLGSLLLSSGASALVARDGTCCFGLTASGPASSGTVDQLSDGQTRVGGTDLSAGTFCIDTNGGITDGQGRGCVITVETTQFQCDDALTNPTLGFSVGSNGILAHNGSTTFYVCETGGNGENIYISTGPDVTECTPTTLTADNCKNAASSCAVSSSSSYISSVEAATSSAPAVVASSSTPASSAPVVSSSTPASSAPVVSSSVETSSAVAPSSAIASTETVATATPATSSAAASSSSSVVVASSSSIVTSVAQTSSALPTTSSAPASTSATQTTTQSSSASSSCATAVNTAATYQYPHLIVPVSSSSPSTAYGTSYFGSVNSTFSTIFNFDIPSSYSGKTCSLVFLFPLQSELETSSYTFSGDGEIDFKQLSSVASESTTYSSIPSTETDFGTTTIAEGNSYIISQFECSTLAGQAVSYEMSEAGTTSLYFFEDYNPSPLGLYITAC